MSTDLQGPTTTGTPTRSSNDLRVDQIVTGVLIGAVGVGWLLDQAGGSVPWRMFPAAALIFIGLALIATLLGGRGRGGLVGLGIISLILAVVVGVGADRYAGPVGDQLVAPAVGEWPVQQHISAGTVTIDLTRHPLPEAGRLQIDVGAGEIDLILPSGATAGIDATATAGTITVDGVKVGDGVDLQWSKPSNTSSPVELTLHVGLGDIQVSHE
jgi:hypothetical protein